MSDKISVLVIEDEEIFRDLFGRKIRSAGYKCFFAESIMAAMRKVKDGFVPEVAIIDWRAPDVYSDTDAVDRARFGPAGSFGMSHFLLEQTDERCRVILTSALFKVRSSLSESGAWGYFYKGGDWNKLFDYIKLGFLKEDEIGKPIMELEHEFGKRAIERG